MKLNKKDLVIIRRYLDKIEESLIKMEKELIEMELRLRRHWPYTKGKV